MQEESFQIDEIDIEMETTVPEVRDEGINNNEEQLDEEQLEENQIEGYKIEEDEKEADNPL